MATTKKSLLFVINNLNCGGAEKALVSLLQTIDYSKYAVDLFVFKHEGVFFENLPKEVCVLEEQKIVPYLYSSTTSAVLKALKSFNFRAIWLRLQLFLLSKKHQSGVAVEQYFWKYYAKGLSTLDKEYDVAIGFQEKNPIYFCVDKVKANIKIGWIHTDLVQLGLDFQHEQYYFDQLNHLVTVSEGLTDRLQQQQPQFQSKIITIENIISSKVLTDLSQEPTATTFDSNYFNIIYVGRIAKEKGLFMGLEALKILVEQGYAVRWYLIGEGNQKEQLLLDAARYGIASHLFFLGLKSNPYPYISKASAFLLPSFFEGKSISLEEAKLLHKPIVIADFSSAKDQIEHGVTGLIAAMNPTSIAEKLAQFITDERLRNEVSINLKNTTFGTENEVTKFYQLL
ncbi:glycosyltransferase [Flavobacterium sp.]|uniref:glycosyltransferase n=1 Tax=Flavobacterium sp. TaxID=239 RepID=UPI00260B48D9|nr:glycosyltransferase [Flavobacterium sp.]